MKKRSKMYENVILKYYPLDSYGGFNYINIFINFIYQLIRSIFRDFFMIILLLTHEFRNYKSRGMTLKNSIS